METGNMTSKNKRLRIYEVYAAYDGEGNFRHYSDKLGTFSKFTDALNLASYRLYKSDSKDRPHLYRNTDIRGVLESIEAVLRKNKRCDMGFISIEIRQSSVDIVKSLSIFSNEILEKELQRRKLIDHIL